MYFARWPCSRSARTRSASTASSGDERAGVAHRAEVLARVEAEGRRDADRAGAEAVALGAVRLAGVLDDVEPVVRAATAASARMSAS